MNMRWSLLKLLCGLFVVGSVLAEAQTLPTISISSNVLREVLGPARARGLPAWNTNTAYVAGQKVEGYLGGHNYLCLVGGTSTNSTAAAVNGLGIVTDGTVTWISMLNRVRKALVIQNTSTNANASVFVSDFVSAGTNISKSVTLLSGGTWFYDAADSVPQGSIFVWAPIDATITVWED